jgi:hypothetical protein
MIELPSHLAANWAVEDFGRTAVIAPSRYWRIRKDAGTSNPTRVTRVPHHHLLRPAQARGSESRT